MKSLKHPARLRVASPILKQNKKRRLVDPARSESLQVIRKHTFNNSGKLSSVRKLCRKLICVLCEEKTASRHPGIRPHVIFCLHLHSKVISSTIFYYFSIHWLPSTHFCTISDLICTLFLAAMYAAVGVGKKETAAKKVVHNFQHYISMLRIFFITLSFPVVRSDIFSLAFDISEIHLHSTHLSMSICVFNLAFSSYDFIISVRGRREIQRHQHFDSLTHAKLIPIVI